MAAVDACVVSIGRSPPCIPSPPCEWPPWDILNFEIVRRALMYHKYCTQYSSETEQLMNKCFAVKSSYDYMLWTSLIFSSASYIRIQIDYFISVIWLVRCTYKTMASSCSSGMFTRPTRTTTVGFYNWPPLQLSCVNLFTCNITFNLCRFTFFN